MKSLNLEGSFISKFFPIWKSSQTDLLEVIRWKPYLEDKIGKNMRKQSTLEHTHSFSLFAGTIAQMLDPFIFEKTGKHLDLLLLEYAFKWHDHSEGLKGKDIPAPLKRDEDDVQEYHIFMNHIEDLPKQVKEKYEKAFLLQFALNDNKLFPKEAKYIMENILKKDYFYEVLIFTALEKYEYLFYPIEMEANHDHLLTWVLRRQITGYQIYAEILPGFREILFSRELEQRFLDYLREHKDVPELKL